MNKFINDIPVYYINLDKDIYKSICMKTQLERICENNNIIRISGIDGIINHINNKLYIFEPKYKIKYINEGNLNYHQIGCILSHIVTLNIFLKSNENKAIIMEDDLIFHENKWKYTINEIINMAPKNYSIIKLQVSEPKIMNFNNKINKYQEFIANEVYSEIFNSISNMSTACYVISKEGAKNVLKMLEKNGIYYLQKPADGCFYNIKNVHNYTYPLFTFNSRTMWLNYFEVYSTENTLDFYEENIDTYNVIVKGIDKYEVSGYYKRCFMLDLAKNGYMIYLRDICCLKRYDDNWYLMKNDEKIKYIGSKLSKKDEKILITI